VPRGVDEEALREAGLDPSKAKVGERHLLFDLEDEVEARRAVASLWRKGIKAWMYGYGTLRWLP